MTKPRKPPAPATPAKPWVPEDYSQLGPRAKLSTPEEWRKLTGEDGEPTLVISPFPQKKRPKPKA